MKKIAETVRTRSTLNCETSWGLCMAHQAGISRAAEPENIKTRAFCVIYLLDVVFCVAVAHFVQHQAWCIP